MSERWATAAARTVCGLFGLALAAWVVSRGPAIAAAEIRSWFAAGGLWVALAAGALGVGLWRLGWPPGRLLMAMPRRVFAGLVFVIALGSGVWAHFKIEKGVPDVPDEFSYLHQARGFADGELAPASPPLEEFHYTSWAVHDGGRWYSVFPPGYGVLLAVGVKAGVPWLINPLLGALLAIALFALGRELFGGDVVAARAAVIVYLASWFRLMHAGSYMSHPTAALFTVLAVLGVIRGARSDGAWRWGALGGAALAALAATRPLNAVILGIVLVPLALVPLVSGGWRRLLPPILAALPLLVAYGAYNRALTGSALLPPQQRYMSLKEEVGDCFRIGFGPGVGQCPITQNTHFGKDGFQYKDARKNTEQRVDSYIRFGFGFAPLAALPVLGALLGALAAAAQARARTLAAAVVVATVVGYGLFFYHGIAYGPRFYYESFPLAALLSAAAIADGERIPWAPVRAALAAILFSLLVVGLIVEWPDVKHHAGERRRTDDGKLLEALRAPAAHDAVVFVDSLVLSAAMTEHPGDIDANHPLVVRDFGDAADAGYLRVHPRPAFRLVGQRLVPVHFPEDAPIRDEGGGLYPLEIAAGGFGDRAPSNDVFKLPLSDGAALRFRAKEPGAHFAFPTFTPDAGALVLHIETVVHPQGPTIQVAVDGKPVSDWLPTKDPTPALRGFDLPVTLTAGRHWISFAMKEPGTFFLDHVELGKPR